jgi:hypothetical protein
LNSYKEIKYFKKKCIFVNLVLKIFVNDNIFLLITIKSEMFKIRRKLSLTNSNFFYLPCVAFVTEIETNSHLFLTCSFAEAIWIWLGSCLNTNYQFSDVNEAFKLCNSN